MKRCWGYGTRLRRCRHQHRLLSHLHASESITIPCRSKGSIQLDIYHPSTGAPSTTTPSTVIVYLPPGPFLPKTGHAEITIPALLSNLPYPVVNINYRVGEAHQFPTPIHDVLAGYDWIKENLLPKRSISRPGRSSYVGRVAVCGELVSGGLATMLGLTECRVGEPGIVAVAIRNPIVDWVGLDDQTSDSRSKPTSASAEPKVEALRTLRSQLFRKPEHYFDPFASPVLFFRSAGADVPPAPPSVPRDDMEHLIMLEQEDFYRQQLALSAMSSPKLEQRDTEPSSTKRKASRRFPGAASGLRLPPFYITSATKGPLAVQAAELAKLLRQSYVRRSTSFGVKSPLDDGANGHEDEGSAAARLMAEEAVNYAMLVQGDAFASSNDVGAGRERDLELVEWLRGKLA